MPYNIHRGNSYKLKTTAHTIIQNKYKNIRGTLILAIVKYGLTDKRDESIRR
jgi:hypothetical protein